MAVGVHALLLAFLWIGVNWQNEQPVQVEAEVWDMKVQSAAPPPPPPVQEAEPEPEPEPQPQRPPKVVEQPAPPAPAPDIRLEREKQRKEELRKEELRRERELAEQKAREEKLAAKKAKEEALKKEQAKKEEAEKKAKELAEKKEAEKKEKAEKLAKAKADAAAKAKLESQRKQELARMMDQAGNGASGSAAKSTAPRMDSGYLAAITAKIKSATHYAGSTDEPGNPTVSFRVEQLPNGEIMSVKLGKSSGIAAFDEAVKRGIENATPLPKKKDGTVERSLEVFFHMKDLK